MGLSIRYTHISIEVQLCRLSITESESIRSTAGSLFRCHFHYLETVRSEIARCTVEPGMLCAEPTCQRLSSLYEIALSSQLIRLTVLYR